MDELDHIRAEAESFARELALEVYLGRSGQKTRLSCAPIFRRYRRLLTPAVIDAVRARLAGAETDEGRRLRYLLQFLVDRYIAAAGQDLSDRLLELQAGIRIPVGGRRVGYHYATVLLGATADRQARAGIAAELDRARERLLNAVAAELAQRSQAAARSLGYPDYAALCDQTKELDLAGLHALVDQLLAATRAVGQERLHAALSRDLGIAPGEARLHDYHYLKRAHRFDPHFAKEHLVPTLTRTLWDLGIDAAAQENVTLDLTPRAGKSPRAFCSAIRCPEEVVLVLLPKGGQEDYRALLHEAGHAQHFAHADPALPLEYRRFGDLSVSETYAFLLQDLTLDPGWLERHVAMPRPARAEYLRLAHLAKLQLVRRYCGKLRYELCLHGSDGVEAMAPVYVRELTDATHLPYPPAQYLMDVDPGFYTAQYLRAWVLAAQLRHLLRGYFGPGWWASRRAGAFLCELWRLGQKYSAAELAARLGFTGLDPGSLAAELHQGPEA